ncbi:MAG: thioredoxin family protein [Armatimonadota bacterium]|nr:thioredoxin family protein [bacterium]
MRRVFTMTRERWTVAAIVITLLVIAAVAGAVILALQGSRGKPQMTARQKQTQRTERQATAPKTQPAPKPAPAPQAQPGGQQPSGTTPQQPAGGTQPSQQPPQQPQPRQTQPPVVVTPPSGQGAGPGAQTGTQGQAGQQAARQSLPPEIAKLTAGGKPGVMEFTAQWCEPCRGMKSIVDKIKSDYRGRLNVMTVDIDQNPDLTQKYNVTAVPVLLFYDKNGKQVTRHEGYLPSDEFRTQLSQMGVRPAS